MAYEKLSRRALGCMYTDGIIGDVIFIVLIGIVNIFWLIPKQIEIGRWISAVLLIYAAVSMLVEPYFRYNRYRYSINEECIDIREGYLFVKRNIVPIERLHKLEISKGPIDQIFHVAKVTVTTAGGDVTLRFLEEEKAEKIAENLQKRINEIVKRTEGRRWRIRSDFAITFRDTGAVGSNIWNSFCVVFYEHRRCN